MVGGQEQQESTSQRPDMTAFLNGRFMPQSQAIEEMKQDGVQSTGGFYDNERTFAGKIFRLEDHLHRLYNGLDYTKIDPGMTLPQMADTTMKVLEANVEYLGPQEEFLVTQIVSPRPNAAPDEKANVVIYCQFLETAHFALHYTEGIRLVTPATYGIPTQNQKPGKGPVTMQLMMNAEGNITECQGGNFIFVRGGRIQLPNRRNVLPGVSMKTVLELAGELDIPIDEGDYVPGDVYEATEALVTSTRFCMAPVVSLNGLGIGTGLRGPIIKKLFGLWKEMVGLDFVRQAVSRTETHGPIS